MKHAFRVILAVALVGVAAIAITACGAGPSGGAAPSGEVQIAGAHGGEGFDDLRYSSTLHRMLLAGGSARTVSLIDPETLALDSISGLPAVYSVDEGDGFLFVADRENDAILQLDATTHETVSSTHMNETPDYLRYLPERHELWFSVPSAARVDVWTLDNGVLTSAAQIPVTDGPEGLRLAPALGKAFFHEFGGKLGVIDLAQRKQIDQWPTGCARHHGIPEVDEQRHLVFAGCSSAEVAVLDSETGEVKGHFTGQGGASLLSYSPSKHHFYLRGDPGVPVFILGVPASGIPERLGSADATSSGHCIATDDAGHVFVCDGDKGKLLRFDDAFDVTE